MEFDVRGSIPARGASHTLPRASGSSSHPGRCSGRRRCLPRRLLGKNFVPRCYNPPGLFLTNRGLRSVRHDGPQVVVARLCALPSRRALDAHRARAGHGADGGGCPRTVGKISPPAQTIFNARDSRRPVADGYDDLRCLIASRDSSHSIDSQSRSMPTFTVDTHVFRELGELLVGRDSTALIELIKNSYDADATEVVVYGEDYTISITALSGWPTTVSGWTPRPSRTDSFELRRGRRMSENAVPYALGVDIQEPKESGASRHISFRWCLKSNRLLLLRAGGRRAYRRG